MEEEITYFLMINKIQDQLNCHSHNMTLLLLYFLQHPAGNYNDFIKKWIQLYQNDRNKINVKSQLHKIRDFNLLYIDKNNFYTFDPNGKKDDISDLNQFKYGTQYQEVLQFIKDKYNIYPPDDFKETDVPGTYEVYNKQTKELLYIGSSIHMFQRKAEHYMAALWKVNKMYFSEKYTIFRELIQKDLLEWVMWCKPDLNIKESYTKKEIEELRKLEKIMIQNKKPLLNKRWNNG